MSQQPNTPPPVTAVDLPDHWLGERREIIFRDGHALRAGAGLWIEVQSINSPDYWGRLNLPGNVTTFATLRDRDLVLEKLWHDNHEHHAKIA